MTAVVEPTNDIAVCVDDYAFGRGASMLKDALHALGQLPLKAFLRVRVVTTIVVPPKRTSRF